MTIPETGSTIRLPIGTLLVHERIFPHVAQNNLANKGIPETPGSDTDAPGNSKVRFYRIQSHNSGHRIESGRGGEIRTPDPLLPKQLRYQAALHPDSCRKSLNSLSDKARNHTPRPLNRQWIRDYLRRQRVPSAPSSISIPASTN